MCLKKIMLSVFALICFNVLCTESSFVQKLCQTSVISATLFSIKPLPVHELAKPFAYNQCHQRYLKHLKKKVQKVSYTSRSRTSTSSSDSIMTSPFSAGWLEHVVGLQRSEHFRPLMMQSHVVSTQDFLQLHAIYLITAFGACKPSIQSVSTLSLCSSVSRNQLNLPTGVGTSFLRRQLRQFFQTAA